LRRRTATIRNRNKALVGGLSILSIGALVVGIWWHRESERERLRFRQEADRLVELLDLEPGAMVADIGAGQGLWTVDLARRVGDGGHVYATVRPLQPAGVFEEVARSELRNISVLVETERVPRECCHALLVRRMFHHFEDSAAAASTLFHELREGGRAIVIDFDQGTASYDEGHGIARGDVEEAMTSAGFELTQAIDDWEAGTYCLVFTRPEAHDVTLRP
jgi:predicted methyltransferase